MSKCASSPRVRRVSSQAMTSTSRSTRSARAEMSSRLPIGVATTNRVPRALRLCGLFLRLGDQHRPLVIHDHFAGDDALLEALDRRQLVHDLEHDLFQDGAQTPCARAALERLSRDGGHRVVGELETHFLEVEVLLVLLDDRVLRLLEDADERRVVEVVQGGDDGQPAHELRDEAVAQEILGLDHRQQVPHAAILVALDLGAEAHARASHPRLDVLVEADEGAAADEEDVRGIDLNELLMRMLASALRRNIRDGAFENLQEGLLHPFAGHVARDRRILGFPSDLVDLVDVDDAALRALDVVVGRLQQPQDDVLDVLADVPRLGQRGGIGDGEGHAKHLGQRLRQQRLAGAGGADQQYIRLLQLDVAVIVAGLDALVVVVNGHRQDLLGALLTDHVLIEDGLDLGRLGKGADLPRLFLFPLLGDDVVAELDALVADVDGGPGDELAHIVLALAAERALQRPVAFARPTRHARRAPYRWTCAASAACSLTARVVGFEEMTSSTIL